MRKEYILNGLDCASCAAKVSDKLNALKCVESANINFANKTLKINYNGDAEKYESECILLIKKFEPDVTVETKEHGHHHQEHNDSKANYFTVISGFLIFLLTYLSFVTGTPKLIITLIAYVLCSWSVIVTAAKKVRRLDFIDENFLMLIATIGALVIGQNAEAIAVMLFYQVGEFFQDKAVAKSRKSIADLMNIKPDTARITVDGEERTVAPEQVEIGQIIKILPGEKVPLDGVVKSGLTQLDTSALTGESLPRDAIAGTEVLSGCINLSGIIYVTVAKSFEQSTVSKILELVENAAEKKSPAENFITKFSRIYTPCVVAAAAMLALVPGFITGDFAIWTYRALTFLVVSCPCALVISIPLSYFGAIGAASKHGILVKGGNYLEALSGVKTVVFDKTGTLTTGRFTVSSVNPYNGFSADELLKIAASAESGSNHPIARSVIAAYGKEIDSSLISDYTEIAAHGIKAVFEGKTVLAGNAKLMKMHRISVPAFNSVTSVLVAVDGVFAGYIEISDELKKDSAAAINKLKQMGISRIIMLTGDNEAAAKRTAKTAGISEYHFGLLPDQKVSLVEKYRSECKKGEKLAFVGDGINDAPVITMADVGIAMGGVGSDSAIEAADIVLMTDEPSRICDSVAISRATRRVVMQNIVFALGVKALVLLLSALGFAHMWGAVFADVGVSLIAVINSMRLLRK